MKHNTLIDVALTKAITLVLLSSFYLTVNGFSSMDLTSTPQNIISLSTQQTSLFGQTYPAVSHIGDVNGDGIDDAILGPGTGAVYVVFGNKDSPDDIDLESLITTGQGFAIYKPSSETLTTSVSAGDINNDRINDIVLFTLNTKNAYVIYGRSSGITDIYLDNLTPSLGFKIYSPANDPGHLQISKAGDFNHDGPGDLLIGLTFASPLNRNSAGTVVILFGQTGEIPNINLDSIPANVKASYIFGINANDLLGYSVSSAGDFNNDGTDDIIIATGQWNTYGDKFYVIYGNSNPFTNLDLASLTDTQGFKIASDNGGAAENGPWTVANAGDFNNDGINDIVTGVGLISSRTGSTLGVAYVIFGKTGGLPSTDLINLNQTQRYAIMGNTNYFRGPCFATTAADLNGDGISDIAFGFGYTNYFMVVYGRNDSVSSVTIDSLKTNEGFSLKYNSSLCACLDIVGDFDKDGKNDLIYPGGTASYIMLGGERSSNSSDSKIGAIIGGIVGAVLFVIIMAIAIRYIKRRRDRKRKEAVQQNKQIEKEEVTQIPKEDKPNLPEVPIAPPEPCGKEDPLMLIQKHPEAQNQQDVAIPVPPENMDYAPKMSKEEAEAQNRSKFKPVIPLDQAIEHAKQERLDNYEQQQAVDQQNADDMDEPLALDHAIELALREEQDPMNGPPGDSLKIPDEVRAELEKQP